MSSIDEYINGVSGVLVRSINKKIDLRKNKKTTYSYYQLLSFLSYTSKNGDSLDRFNLRIYEILESALLINSTCILTSQTEPNKNIYFMEDVIKCFKI